MKKYTCVKPWGSHFIKPTIMGINGHMGPDSIKVGDCNTLLLSLDRSSKLKFNKGPAVKL